MILGGGKITQYLCEMLDNRGSISVKVIEEDRKLCDYLCTQFPSLTVINGDPVERDILLEEGVAQAGAVISITDQDEENILLSLFAKNASKAKLITKISRTDFDEVIKPLDLDSVIVPKNITADMILQYVRSTNGSIGSNVETLYKLINGEVEAAEFSVKETSEITDKPLFKLELKNDVLIASILRGKNVIIPRGNGVILPGDNVIIVSKNLTLHDINDILK
jgi:trk system potassium uptake protein TrkA